MTVSSADFFTRVDAEIDGYVGELQQYLRIPSVSTDPAFAAAVDRCSRFLLGRMRAAGLEAERITGLGFPLVYGAWTGATGQPTVLFYGHYDVQPADPEKAWGTPPFEPTVVGGDIVARGASDDKGPSFAHLKAVDALLRERGRLPVNVKFLVEGEEESGGTALERFLRSGDPRLACDCVVISDTPMFGPGRPSLIYALRGFAGFQVRVRGPRRDLHSGRYGGAVANPLDALVHILSRLHDPATGRVAVPGFYDRVQPLAAWEREEMARLEFDDEVFRREAGAPELRDDEGHSTLERLWALPSLDLHGVFGGYQGPGFKTVIPADCGAKLSARLVPAQDPAEIAGGLGRFVESVAPRGVAVEVRKFGTASPVLLDPAGSCATEALAALQDVWGVRPVRVRHGGTIPIVSTLTDVLQVPILLIGFGQPDDGVHAPNEKLSLAGFDRGIRVTGRLLDRLGELGRARISKRTRPSDT